MKLASFTRAVCAIVLLSAGPLAAQGMMVHDAYARSSTAASTSGAAFMVLMNHSGSDDRLIGASSDVAKKVELHQHAEDANGVMRMGEIEGGVPIGNDEAHTFKRGGDHLMFMGLNRPLVQGEMIKVTLEFEKAGEVEIEITVDQDRQPDEGAMDHSTMDHGTMDHSDHSKASE
ncbi:copper chaperone PCu(A)C [Sulfitobacter sp. CW3]|uniref:copper chaperone PCu(A)C n=1 Tax=Sulfitobacter sp. CW3 TaxID=2861965 RepID=UPI001C5D5178|nr:copper chaperone PCu(A)C [Sulfitobacter sp. CW3]MBW4961147.1 copper chaperone PCu(A)C [Sulfitobacter sp. CW3]